MTFGGVPKFEQPDKNDPDVIRNKIERKLLDKQRQLFTGFNIEDTIFASAKGTALEDERKKNELTARRSNNQV